MTGDIFTKALPKPNILTTNNEFPIAIWINQLNQITANTSKLDVGAQ